MYESPLSLSSESALVTLVMNSAPGIAFVADPNGTMLAWNRGYTELLGWVDLELANKNVLELVAPIDREAARVLLARLSADEQFRIQLDLRRHDGGSVPCDIFGARLEIGGRSLLFGLGMDVSELASVLAVLASPFKVILRPLPSLVGLCALHWPPPAPAPLRGSP